MKKYIFLLLLIPYLVSGDTLELNLRDALDMGLENSINLKIEELNVASRKRALDSVHNIFYPRLTATAGLSRKNEPVTTTALVPIPSSATPYGSFEQVAVMDAELSPYTLLASFKAELAFSPAMFDSIRNAGLEYRAGVLSREEAEKKLIRDIKKSFYRILLIEENLKLYSDLSATLQERYAQTLSDYNNGFVSELTLLNMRIAYESMIPGIRKLVSTCENSLTMFKLALGISTETEVKLLGEIEIPELDLPGLPGEDALSHRFDLVKLENSMAQLEAGIKGLVHSAYYPVIALSAVLNPVLPDPFSAESWEPGIFDNWKEQGSVSLLVSLPVDNFLPSSGKANEIKAMQNQLEALKLQKKLIRENAAAETDMLLNSLKDTLSQLEALDWNVLAAEKNLELTEEAYKSGLKDFVALQDAEDNLREARQNVLAEKATFLNIVFDLEYALNIELTADRETEKGE